MWASKDDVRARNGKKLFIPRDVPEKSWEKFTRRADGRYRPTVLGCGYLSPGRESYLDPDF